MNIPVESNNNNFMDKFLGKPIAIVYNTVKNLDYVNLKFEKESYNKHFGEDCVDWFIIEMLRIETYMKEYF